MIDFLFFFPNQNQSFTNQSRIKRKTWSWIQINQLINRIKKREREREKKKRYFFHYFFFFFLIDFFKSKDIDTGYLLPRYHETTSLVHHWTFQGRLPEVPALETTQPGNNLVGSAILVISRNGWYTDETVEGEREREDRRGGEASEEREREEGQTMTHTREKKPVNQCSIAFRELSKSKGAWMVHGP